MSTEENKTLARRFCTALNTALDGRDPAALTEQDLAVFDEIMTPDLARKHQTRTAPAGLQADGAITASRSRT